MAEKIYFQQFCDTDPFWDHSISWNTSTPRLTRCFHQTALVWPQTIFLFSLTFFELVHISRSKNKSIPWNTLNKTRLGFSFGCITLNLINFFYQIFLHSTGTSMATKADILAPIFRSASMILITIFLLFHQKKGLHTSALVWLYLFLEAVCFAPVFYQIFLEHFFYSAIETILVVLYFWMLIATLILCSFSDRPVWSIDKTQSPADEHSIRHAISPRAYASFLNQITYRWFTPMAMKGWKESLAINDSWDLEEDMKARYLYPKFAAQLRKYTKTQHMLEKSSDQSVVFNKRKIDEVNFREGTPKSPSIGPKNCPNILTIFARLNMSYLLLGALCKLFGVLAQFIIPQLLKYLIQFIETGINEPLWHGFFIASSMFIVSTLQSIFLNYHLFLMNTIGIRITSSLTAAIFHKAMKLGFKVRKETSTGEIVNLITVDSNRFLDLLSFINLIWSAPLEIIVSLYFLYTELGYSAFCGLIVMIIMLPINALIAVYGKRSQLNLMKQKDQRTNFLNEVLNCIKTIKLYAWEESFIKCMSRLREGELKELRSLSYLTCGISFLSTCAPIIVSVVTFTVYVTVQGGTLTAQKAFVSLSLFNILRSPLTMLPQIIIFLITVMVSIKRLNNFLSSEDSPTYVTRNEDVDAITIKNGHFKWTSKRGVVEKIEKVGKSIPKSTTDNSTKKQSPDGIAENQNDDQEFILSGIDIKVKKGSFIAIVGSVGSGKTAILSALLGEMNCIKGQVNISDEMSIAYVAQQAWIKNCTLKENVLFGSSFDRTKYQEVIERCALAPDIAYLPGGDETEIGEKGINLSGGQKQRVSLARACYADASLYFLDDPLSAVDAHVAKHLFDNVFSSKTGLLRRKTRVLVTNRLDILSKVDNIIVLKNGQISEMGSYHELMSSKKELSELVKQFNSVKSKNSEGEMIESEHTILSSSEEGISENQSTPTRNDDEKKLIQDEKAVIESATWKVYLEYLRKVTLPWLIIVILSYVGSISFSLGSNIWLAKWSTISTKSSGENTTYFLSIYVVLGALQGIFAISGSTLLVNATLKASIDFHKDMFYRILRSPMLYFDTTPSGRIMNRFTKDIDTVDSVIPQSIGSLLSSFLDVVGIFIIIIIGTPMLVFVLFPLGFVYGLIQRMYIATSRQLKRLESITRSSIYSYFGEALNGVSTINAFQAQERFFVESNLLVDCNQSWYYSNIVSGRWLGIRLELCGNLIVLLVAIFAILARDHLTGGDVGLSVSYALSVTLTLNWLVRMSSQLGTSMVAVERISEYCHLPSEADWFVGRISPKPDWPKNGEIIFENYATRYRAGLELVIHNISAHIKPQEKVGMVGRTGAGKSTITQSLFRLIEPVEGKIIIDDYNICDLPLNPLRSRLAIIPQDPVLFSGTLRFNLDPFDRYTDGEIWESLSHAHLKEFVSSLKEGLQYTVAEEGKNLSVGQRQLICLARVSLKKPRILFLDEATSAIDLETDSLIQATIRRELKKCTILTIAHRLDTIIDSDRVMVLDCGQIAEFDKPGNLLQNRSSIFFSLAKEANLVS